MYFILEIIIFIARLFPDRQRENNHHEQSEHEKKPDDASANPSGSAKSPPKPRRDQTTAKVATGSHGSSESARISTHRNASLEHGVIDTSTLINAHGSSPQTAQRSVHLQRSTRPLRPCYPPPPRRTTHELQHNSIPTGDTHHQPDHRRYGTVGSLPGTNVEQAMVDIVVQAGGANASETHPRKTSTLRNAEGRKQDVISDTYIYISPSSDSSSESTLVNSPTEALSPLKLQQECGEEAHASGGQKRSEEAEVGSTRPLLAPTNGWNGDPSEAVVKMPQSTDEPVAAEQTGPEVQECLLRSEEAAHRETRSELSRLEAWCDAMHDENAMLQTQLQTADEKAKKMRKELGAAEDEATKFQTQLSDAENNIRGFKELLPELQRIMVEREHQLGIDVYSRLQDVGRLIGPHDGVWAEYKDLMNAVAQRFSIPPNARDENINSHDVSRIEELGEVEDGDGKERDQNESGAPTFNTDMMGDNTLTNEVDAIQAEGYGTTSDDDDDHDDISRHGRPMRPGTASRLSMSFFTVQSEGRLRQTSSSHLEGPQEVQEACEPALPAPSSSHPYPEAPVDLEKDLESSSGFKFTFGSSLKPTSEEADLSQATGEAEEAEGSILQPEASQPMFSISFDFAGETSRDEGSRRRSNRSDGRRTQNSSGNKARLSRMSELAYDPAIFDFSRQSQPEESIPSSSSGVTENRDSEPLEAENESGSQTQGASDVIGDATAAVIDPSLEAQYNLLIQSTNTVAELREARDGKTRMTDGEPEDAPSGKILRATWAPFPWVEEEIKKSPAELMKELPFDWMLPTPPRIRPSDVQDRIGESSRSPYSSAVQEWMHIANMKAWIDSIAPLAKGFNAAKTLKIKPSRATSKAQGSKNADGRTPDAMPLSEDQTEEAENIADGQTQELKPLSGIEPTQMPRMEFPPFDEELLSLINGIRNMSLGPSIDAAGKVEKDSRVQVPRSFNVSGQEHTENLENLINGIRDLSLGPSVDEAGRHTKESRVQLSGDWNVSGRGQYSQKDLDKGPIFGRFLGRKSEVRDPGFTVKKEQIAAPEEERTKEIDHKCKKAQIVVKPSKEQSTRPADAQRQEQHETTSPVPTSEQQSTTNHPRTTPHPEQPKKQNVTTNQPAVTASTTETAPQNTDPPQPHEPRPAIPAVHQPPPQTEETYVSAYSLQGLHYPDAAPKTKYRDPFGLRKEKK